MTLACRGSPPGEESDQWARVRWVGGSSASCWRSRSCSNLANWGLEGAEQLTESANSTRWSLHPLGPQGLSGARWTDCMIFLGSEEARLRGQGVLLPSTPISSQSQKRWGPGEGEMGTWEGETKNGHYGFHLEWDRPLSAFLVWMKTSAGRCSPRGTTWSAKLEPLVSGQTRKTLLICIPRFPGIKKKKYIFQSWELGWGIITYNSSYKENGSDSLVYLVESHHST